MQVLIEKMDRHFFQWSKRNLSLLGKIQIYKTFGLSQYLYHLSVLEPTPQLWKKIYDKIQKFLWNKTYSGNTAPSRIKKICLETPIHQGGFGMVDIKQVVTALRIRRHLTLVDTDIHPMHGLIHCLSNNEDYLSSKTHLDIDEVTNINLRVLQQKRFQDLQLPLWQLEADLIMQKSLLRMRVENLVRPKKLNGRELRDLQRAGGFLVLRDVLQAHGAQLTKLLKIVRPELKNIINIMLRNYPIIE